MQGYTALGRSARIQTQASRVQSPPLQTTSGERGMPGMVSRPLEGRAWCPPHRGEGVERLALSVCPSLPYRGQRPSSGRGLPSRRGSVVPKAGLVGPPLHSPHQTSRSDVSRPCPSHPPRTAGVAGRQSRCLLTHSLGPKPQRTCRACWVSIHAYTHSEPPPPTQSHTCTPAGTMSCRPAHPLDSSVLMGPRGRGGRPGEQPGPQLTRRCQKVQPSLGTA